VVKVRRPHGWPSGSAFYISIWGVLFEKKSQAALSWSEKIRSYTDIGELVPISIIKEIIEKVLEDSSNESIILDGFPRSEEQADLLDDVLIRLGLDLKGVYFFSIGDNAIIDRITNRRYCPVCRKVYNLKSAPPMHRIFFRSR